MTARRFCPQPHPLVSAIPAFSDNYIWLIRAPGSDLAAVVDPGDAAPVEAALERAQLRLAAILLTHHHGDHVGGVERLKRLGAPYVFGPRGEAIDDIDQRCGQGDTITVPGLDLELSVIDVPGHTRGHIAYFARRFGDDPRPLLFCGDTLFAAGCGRLFEGTPEQMLDSLGKLAALPPDTLVFCAHEYTLSNLRFAAAVEPESDEVLARLAEVGEQRATGESTVPSSIGVELGSNPFLRSHLPEVRRAAATRLGHDPSSTAESFAAIREWKNGFR
jgi:hydroxyacylglutathione hydrolase